MEGNRIRIGYVIDQLHYGGAEGQLCELVRGINRQYFQCFVYCLSQSQSPYEARMRAAGGELRFLTRHGHYDIVRLLNLARLLRRDRIDIVHAFLFLANGYTWVARRLAGVPNLVTSARNCKAIGTLRGWVNRFAFHASDAIICNGEAVQAFATQHFGAPPGKTAVIPNGVDLKRFAVATGLRHDDGARLSSAPKQVLTIGRLVPQKDLDLFLEAAALLVRATGDVHFLIVGDGPCREALRQTANRSGLGDHVTFLGVRGDIPDLLHHADIFWLTSAWEGMPNVVLEAMACAKPVVARDVGACHELIHHGVNGYLVANRDAETFADYTRQLLANPAQARAMGRAGLKLVADKFSVAAMIQSTEKLYRSIFNT